jgi:hypothetical protein
MSNTPINSKLCMYIHMAHVHVPHCLYRSHTPVCMYTHTCVYVHTHLCVCTHTPVCMNTHIHVQVQPEEYQCVTIFFSEVVNFTTMATTMETHLVISMLDRLYTKFDVLTEWCRDSKPSVSRVETPNPVSRPKFIPKHCSTASMASLISSACTV